MLNEILTSGKTVVLDGFATTSGPFSGPWVWLGEPFNGLDGDFLGTFITTSFVNRSEPLHPNSLIGRRQNDVPDDGVRRYTGNSLRGGAGVSIIPYVSGWGSYADRIKALFTDWKFDRGEAPRASEGENSCLHENLFGTVVNDPTSRLLFLDDGEVHDKSTVPFNKALFVEQSNWSLFLRDVEHFQPAQREPFIGYYYCAKYLAEIAEDVRSGAWDIVYFQNPRKYVDFDFDVTPSGHVSRISYTFLVDRRVGDPGPMGIRAHRVDHTFAFGLNPDYAYIGGYLELNEVSPYTHKVSIRELACLDFHVGPPAQPSDWLTVFDHRTGQYFNDPQYEAIFEGRWAGAGSPSEPYEYELTTQTVLGSDILPMELPNLIGHSPSVGYYNSGDGSFLSFMALAHTYVPDCVSAAFMSNSVAVDEMLGALGADHIETLNELGDILSPIDVVKAFYHLKDIRGAVACMSGFLSFLADAKLTYSLAVAPTIGVAEQLSSDLIPVIARMKNAEQLQRSDGEWKGVVENPGHGFSAFHVTLRSHVRARLRSGTLLASVLPLNSLGLLPSTSQLWNLIPLSFVLDWRTRTGDALGIIDKSTALLAIECQYTVNSFTIEYFFDDDELRRYGCARKILDNGSYKVGYRLYGRYVSPVLSFLGPTRLPVMGRIGVPDWALAGSLVYKIVT